MSGTTEPLPNNLEGLPKILDQTLIAHPDWEHFDGKIVCAGSDCEWVKPSGKSIGQRWRNHLAFELQWAIGEWHDKKEDNFG